MKSLIRKIYSNKFAILLRNSFKIKPIRISKYYLNKNISMSDSFLFRTDNGFKTIFKFSDIPKIFYDYENTSIDLFFYNYENKFIKKVNIQNSKKLNYLLLDKDFLNGEETFGHFYLFHNIKNIGDKKISISNRCYVGFSKNDNNFSFVHGNMYVKSKDLNTGEINSNFSNKSLFLNSNYNLQESFSDLDKIELFICNPLSKNIKIKVNQHLYKLDKNCDLKIALEKINKIKIKSNCTSLRPIVFTFKGKYYDVHHG